MDFVFTPSRKLQTPRQQRIKRFSRKPAQKSQRSTSKKSFDSSVKQMYIKSPGSINKQKRKQADFFTVLAEELKSKAPQTQKRQNNRLKFKHRHSELFENIQLLEDNPNIYKGDKTQKKFQPKIKALQAQIQLKNHEISILSGQIQRLKMQIQQERQKRRKSQLQRKQLSKQLKQVTKGNDSLKTQIRKFQKQKQHLMKQIQFLQRINYDQKTRSLQSYREKYLESEVQKLKKQLNKSRDERQQQLQNQIRIAKQQKFTIESHYKAMKVANQCLIKQINFTQQNIHDIILNSDEYKKLRDKYIRFLEEYKQLRSQYWSLKAQSNNKNRGNDSSLFSLTASQVEEDLTILIKNQSFIENKKIKLKNSKTNNPQFQLQNKNQNQPSYTYK